jgi:hypothetical protein
MDWNGVPEAGDLFIYKGGDEEEPHELSHYFTVGGTYVIMYVVGAGWKQPSIILKDRFGDDFAITLNYNQKHKRHGFNHYFEYVNYDETSRMFETRNLIKKILKEGDLDWVNDLNVNIDTTHLKVDVMDVNGNLMSENPEDIERLLIEDIENWNRTIGHKHRLSIYEVRGRIFPHRYRHTDSQIYYSIEFLLINNTSLLIQDEWVYYLDSNKDGDEVFVDQEKFNTRHNISPKDGLNFLTNTLNSLKINENKEWFEEIKPLNVYLPWVEDAIAGFEEWGGQAYQSDDEIGEVITQLKLDPTKENVRKAIAVIQKWKGQAYVEGDDFDWALDYLKMSIDPYSWKRFNVFQ